MEHQFDRLGLTVEFIEGVDGRELGEERFKKLTDAHAVKYSPQWITPGAVGCVMSHRICYKKLVESGDAYALILEDDIVLDKKAVKHLEEMGAAINRGEVMLLYFQSFKTIEFSDSEAKKIDSRYRIMYPVNFESLGSTGGYFIASDAAKKLYDNVLPIKVSADSWGEFIKYGYLKSVRVVIPFAGRSSYSESAIDYVGESSLRGRLKSFISTTKLFPFFQLLKLRRQRS